MAAAMAKRTLTKKKKVKKVFSRRAGGGYNAVPTDNFWAFKDYIRTETDKKDISKTIKEYIKKTFSKTRATNMLGSGEPHFVYPYYIAATIEWEKLGFDLPSEWVPTGIFRKYFENLEVMGEANIANRGATSDDGDDTPTPIKRTIQEIVKARTGDFIAEVEYAIDYDVEEFSTYNELKSCDAPYNMAKAVYDYYIPLRDELHILLTKAPAELEEGYRHMSTVSRKKYFTQINTIVLDAEKYMQSKKAVRKTRIAKPMAADKQIKNVKYLKDSPEYKVTSINPALLIGARRIYTFNVKSKIITEYVCHAPNGFTLKGTTLQSVDVDVSRETRLRKPEEFLQVVMKQSIKQIATDWSKLTTKTNTPNGRINQDTILLRIMDR